MIKWLGSVIFFNLLGALCIFLGIKGFAVRGIPWTAKKFIPGFYGTIIGTIVLLFGILFAVAGFSGLFKGIGMYF